MADAHAFCNQLGAFLFYFLIDIHCRTFLSSDILRAILHAHQICIFCISDFETCFGSLHCRRSQNNWPISASFFFFAWLCNIFLQNSKSIFGICSNCFPKYLWLIFHDVVTVKVTFWWLFHVQKLCCRAEHCTTTPFSLCVIWRFCFALVAAHRQNHFLGLLDFALTSTAPLNWIFYEILDSGNCELEALWYLFMGLPCFIDIS